MLIEKTLLSIFVQTKSNLFDLSFNGFANAVIMFYVSAGMSVRKLQEQKQFFIIIVNGMYTYIIFFTETGHSDLSVSTGPLQKGWVQKNIFSIERVDYKLM